MRGQASTSALIGALLSALAMLIAAGCGSSHSSSSPSSPSSAATATQTSARTTTATGAGALQAEATAAAAGDIPDNQVFLVYRDTRDAYSMKYPEGWAQLTSQGTTTFRDKNNIARIVVQSGHLPTAGSVAQELGGASRISSTQRITIHGVPALKVVYTTTSAPNPVTGKRVTLTVDRYYVGHGNKRAVVDLGTPVGVDNVDAYRLMIESFRWR